MIVIETLIVGWLSGKLLETTLILFMFALLRFFSGGFHIRSTVGCNIVSTAICSGIPHIPVMNEQYTIILTVISLILIYFFAPNVDINTVVDKKYYKLLKYISLVIVSSNFLFLSYTLCIAFLIQSLTLFPLRKEVIQ
jgi:accessory gene regulator B